jgi:hypothetical protein
MPSKTTSSPGGEETGEGVRSFGAAALFPIKNHLIIGHKSRSAGEAVPPLPFACFVYFVVKQVPNHKHFPCDFPTRNQFPKLNLAAIFSLQPLASSVSLEPFVTTFRKANNSCWAPDPWRAGEANFAYSAVSKTDSHATPSKTTSSPGREETGEGVRSFGAAALFPIKNHGGRVQTLRDHKCPSALHLSSLRRYFAMSLRRSKPFVVRFAETTAETPLRFAETSQQTLRHFSLLPTTYNNFAGKNALKLKLLRLLRLDPKLEWNFVAKMAAAARPVRRVHQLWSRCWSPVAKSLPFPSVSSSLPIDTASSPGGEDQDEGVRSLRPKEPLFPMRDSRRGDLFFWSADSPVRASYQKHTEHTKNTVRHNGNTIKTHSRHSPKHNGNTIKPQQNTQNTIKTHSFFSGDPNVTPRSGCSAYPFEKIRNPIQPSTPKSLNQFTSSDLAILFVFIVRKLTLFALNGPGRS